MDFCEIDFLLGYGKGKYEDERLLCRCSVRG